MDDQPGSPEIPEQVPRHVSDWGAIQSPIRKHPVYFALSMLGIALGVVAPLVVYGLGLGRGLYFAIIAGCTIAAGLAMVWMLLMRRDRRLRDVVRWGIVVNGHIDDVRPRSDLSPGLVAFHVQSLSGEVRHLTWPVDDAVLEVLDGRSQPIEALIDPEQPRLVCVPLLQSVAFRPVEDHRPERFLHAPVFAERPDSVLNEPIRLVLYVRPPIHVDAREADALEPLGELRLDHKGLWLKRTVGSSSTRFVAWESVLEPELSAWLLTDALAELNVTLRAEGPPREDPFIFGTRLPQAAMLKSIALVPDAVPYLRPDDFRLLWPILATRLARRELEIPRSVSFAHV